MEKVRRGHMGRIWDDDYKFLPYKKQPVTDYEVQTWRNMGYDYVKSFTGSMYDSKNPMPHWVKKLENAFGLHKQSYTFYKMQTLEIMPVHSDHYTTYCKMNDADPKDVCRALLMLEDWKPGHYLEIDGVGYVNWRAGDWFLWENDVPHAAANIGVEDRYTLQITGQTIYQGQLNILLPFNVPNVREPMEGSNPIVRHKILPKIEDYRDKSIMIYMNNSYIESLKEYTHDTAGRDKLNENGLHIYLFEPVCSYLDGATPKYPHGTKHTMGFYSEFDSKVDPTNMRSDELDSILDYAKRNELTNITVHTGDYNVSDWYPYYKSHLNLITDDLFLLTQEIVQNYNPVPNNKFTKTFLNLNWRFTKHRQLVATFLINMNSHVSWYFKSPFDILCQDMFFNLHAWEHLYPEFYKSLVDNTNYINENGPFCVDKFAQESIWINHPHYINMWPNVKDYPAGTTPALFNGIDNVLESYYNDIFVDIVTETRFAQPTGNFSEKVFQPMQYMKPFILVAPPKTLEYIKSFGFKTFDKYWDESYDQELHHGERLAKIFNLISDLNKKPHSELVKMYDTMIPILEHNVKTYRDIFANPSYTMKRT